MATPQSSNGSKARSKRPEKGHGRALAYDWLKQRIVSLELQPGSSIDEAVLVERLGISRTPLREAIVRLAAEGLIELLPNRGARVTTMDLLQLQEHLEAFDLMQRAATVLAAAHRPAASLVSLGRLCKAFEVAAKARDVQAMIQANWDFHHAIGLACGNRYVERMYSALLTDGLRIARLAMSYESYGSVAAYETHLGQILAEHREIVAAISARDSAKAASLSDSHSNLARRRVADYLSRSSSHAVTVKPSERTRKLVLA